MVDPTVLCRGPCCTVREPYGTVGNCPASSCASRWALSPFSWVASSLGLKVPRGWLLVLPFEAAGAVVLGVWALPEPAPKTTAPTAPPPSIEPAIAAVMMAFLPICKRFLLFTCDG